MEYIFNPRYIKGNEFVFKIYLVIIILILLITLFLVIKSIRRSKNVSK